MRGNFFMQLLIILALLLYGGKNGAQNVLKEVKPVIESLGNEEMMQALKSAEEISSVLSVVKELSGGDGSGASAAFANSEADDFGGGGGAQTSPAIAFPLKPINNIADKDIAYSLSRYINEN